MPDPAAAASVPKPAASFAAAVRLFTAARYAEALPLFTSPALADTPLAAYAAYYGGLCSLKLSRPADARAAFAKVHALRPPGFVLEAAIGREAEAASAQGDNTAAARLYEELLRMNTAAPDALLLALGQAHKASGDRPRAAEAFSRIYYEMPTSELAGAAGAELDGLGDVRPAKRSAARIALDLDRAERLFAAGAPRPPGRRSNRSRRSSAATTPNSCGSGWPSATTSCGATARPVSASRRASAPLSGRRSTLPLSLHHPRARPAREGGRRFGTRPGLRTPDQPVGGGDAQQPGDALHPDRRRRSGRRGVPRSWRRQVLRRVCTPNARPGGPAGGPTGTSARRRRPPSSRAPRQRSRGPTTGRSTSTGRHALASASPTGRAPQPSTASSPPTTCTPTTGAWRSRGSKGSAPSQRRARPRWRRRPPPPASRPRPT